MRTRTFIFLFLVATTTAFGQNYGYNVRIVCTCEVAKFMLSPAARRDAMPYVVMPSCSKHKAFAEPTPEGFYFFEKRKKAKKRRFPKGSHIITPLSN